MAERDEGDQNGGASPMDELGPASERGRLLAQAAAAARAAGHKEMAVAIAEQRVGDARALVIQAPTIEGLRELSDALYLRAAIALEDEDDAGLAWGTLLDRLDVLNQLIVAAPTVSHFRAKSDLLSTLSAFVDAETHGEVYLSFLSERAVVARQWMYGCDQPAEPAGVLADCAELVGQLSLSRGEPEKALAAFHDAIRGLELVAQTTPENNAHAVLRIAAAHWNAASVADEEDRVDHLEAAWTIATQLEQHGLQHEVVTRIRQGAGLALAALRSVDPAQG
jgi:hypothetical protein